MGSLKLSGLLGKSISGSLKNLKNYSSKIFSMTRETTKNCCKKK